MPVLAHVLLDAAPDRGLTVSATDLDVGLSGTYKAEITEAGAVAVHARQLYEIVKTLPSGNLQVSRQENNWIEIKSGPSRFCLVGMAATVSGLAQPEPVEEVHRASGEAQHDDRPDLVLRLHR